MNVDKQRMADAVTERLLKAKPGAKVSITADEMEAFLEMERNKVAVKSALDIQEGGNHYKDLPIQPVQYNHANKLPYLEGNVVKYISRHQAKGGVGDVMKAIHYCQLVLELDYGVKPQ